MRARCFCWFVQGPIVSLLVMLAAVLPGNHAWAETKYRTVTPGINTRVEAERALGAPVARGGGSVVQYSPQRGTRNLEVEYSQKSIVQRIEVRFAQPIPRGPVVEKMIPGGRSTARWINPENLLLEYFGEPNFAVLTYTGADETSGVESIGFYSRDHFSKAVALVPPPTNAVPAALTGGIGGAAVSSAAKSADLQATNAPAPPSGSVANRSASSSAGAAEADQPGHPSGWQQVGTVVAGVLGGMLQQRTAQLTAAGVPANATQTGLNAALNQPGQPQPGQPVYQQPGQPGYQGPGQPAYQPVNPAYQQPSQPGFQPPLPIAGASTGPPLSMSAMRSTEICDRLQGTWAVQVRAAVATDTQRWVVGGRNGANCRLQVAYTHSPQAASVYYDAVLSVTPAAGQQQLRFFWHALGGSEAGAPPEAVLIHGNGAGLFDGRMFQVEWKNQAGYSFQVIGARE